jgi:mannose-1-phosphate guanylyltransferase/mannose-6-phosphate isomerase
MIVPIVLSGGSGTRLWPLSTPEKPKQFLALVSDRTLFQETVLRLEGIPGLGDPVVVCNAAHRELVAGQLREIGVRARAIVLEPEGRNTAPAIGIAALIAAQSAAGQASSETSGPPRDNPVLLVLPADHVIADAVAFRAAVGRAVEAARAGRLVTFGIVPTAPETGYGYIEQGADEGGWHAVARFVEKPDLATAEAYLASGRFLWNSGMFVFGAATFLAELARTAPAIHAACAEACAGAKVDGECLRLGAGFLASPSDSIDYAVMEKTGRAAVVPLAAGWSDVGSWQALHAALAGDAGANVLRGNATTLDAGGNLVVAAARRIALLGVDDLVVVDAGEAVLVARKDRSQDVKELLQQIRREAGKT